MKKNRMMRLASVLLVAVLMTTCTISGTFAKYVTQETGTDTARVAKWGVEIVASGKTFAEAYDVEGNKAASTVVSSTYDTDDTHLVAPGTAGSMANVTVTGKPEVAVRVNYDAALTLAGWQEDVDGDGVPKDYCPLVFNVNGTEIKMGGAIDTVAKLAEAVEAAIEGLTNTYAANTNLEAVNDDLGVSWSWPFEVGADDAAKAVNNAKDTYLGDLAAAGYASTITLSVTTIITQVD